MKVMADTIQSKFVQKRLLIPLTLALVALVIGFGFAFIKSQKNYHDKIKQDLLETSIKTLNNSLIDQSNSLSALAYTIARDNKLRLALKEQNRQQLLHQFKDYFAQLKHDYSITHFYFHRLDRINLLRIHKPEKYGDLINRFTALEAERTQKIASGIELGPLGTFTLRVVLPVREDDHLVGYLELGKEIEDVLARIHEKQGTELAVTIQKTFLNQKEWEQGMSMLGRKASWFHFSPEVMVYQSQPSYPAEFETLLKSYFQGQELPSEVKYQGKIWHGQIASLSDVSGTAVGHLILWYDHTDHHNFLINLTKKVVIVTLVLLVVLFLYLWVVLRQTDKVILNQHLKLLHIHSDLEEAHSKMEKLASTDVLTGLANRRFALQALERLWAEANDNSVPLGCLLIDADGFKKVNDNYGHDAGDRVLCELAKQLNYAVRTDDIVCRLGGDEFLIICPGTNKEGLEHIANQIHSQIANLTITVSDGAWHFSVSIGAAVKKPTMKTMEALIKAADNGVYAAKKAGKNCVRFAYS
jgi:diguanylate cyclase (GGDEF)-like protein